MALLQVYRSLLKEFGPQGWWPLRGRYHPGDYSFPRTGAQQWEICVGALLTQNTGWGNVEKALGNLQSAGAWGWEEVLQSRERKLEQLLRPAGYFRQKAERLKILAGEVQKAGGMKAFLSLPRESLLEIRGIGPETADSILLYAGRRPVFVVDAYTRRLFGGTLFPANARYEDIRGIFERNLPRDWKVYNEFHALIVRKGKLAGGKLICV